MMKKLPIPLYAKDCVNYVMGNITCACFFDLLLTLKTKSRWQTMKSPVENPAEMEEANPVEESLVIPVALNPAPKVLTPAAAIQAATKVVAAEEAVNS